MGYKSRKVEKEVVKKKEQGKMTPICPRTCRAASGTMKLAGKRPRIILLRFENRFPYCHDNIVSPTQIDQKIFCPWRWAAKVFGLLTRVSKNLPHVACPVSSTGRDKLERCVPHSRGKSSPPSTLSIVVLRKNGNSPYLYIFWQVRKPMVARKNDPFISLFELNGVFIYSTSNYLNWN